MTSSPPKTPRNNSDNGVAISEISEAVVYDRHPAYLGVVTAAEEVAPFLSSKVMRLLAVQFVPLFEQISFPPRQLLICEAELSRVQMLCELGGLYACLGQEDITVSVQNQYAGAPEAMARNPSPFFWNRPCYDDVVLMLGDHQITSAAWFGSLLWRVMSGYVQQIESGMAKLLLLCRLSITLLSPTKLEDSVDDLAPYMEVEQIVSKDNYQLSFVFTR